MLQNYKLSPLEAGGEAIEASRVLELTIKIPVSARCNKLHVLTALVSPADILRIKCSAA